MTERNSLKKIVFILSFITVGLVAGVVGMSFLLIQKQNEIRQTEQTSTQKRQDETLISRYRALLEKTQEDREKIETYMVRGDADTAVLLETIETLAERRGILVTENVTVEKVASTTRVLIVTLQTEGQYQTVLSFLEDVQNLPHEISFRDITLRRSSEVATKSALWSLSTVFSIKSFQP